MPKPFSFEPNRRGCHLIREPTPKPSNVEPNDHGWTHWHNTSTKTEIERPLETKIGEITKQHDPSTPTKTPRSIGNEPATPTLNQPNTGHHGGASARDQPPPPNKARPQWGSTVRVHSRRFWSEGGGLRLLGATLAAPLRHYPLRPRCCSPRPFPIGFACTPGI